MFLNIFWFAAPLRSIKDILAAPWLFFRYKDELQLLAAPLTPGYGTLVCRGTPVKNHWLRYSELVSAIINFRYNSFFHCWCSFFSFCTFSAINVPNGPQYCTSIDDEGRSCHQIFIMIVVAASLCFFFSINHGHPQLVKSVILNQIDAEHKGAVSRCQGCRQILKFLNF